MLGDYILPILPFSHPFQLSGEAVLPEEYGGTNGTIDEHRSKMVVMVMMMMMLVMLIVTVMFKVFLERGGKTTERLADETARLQVGLLNSQVFKYLGVSALDVEVLKYLLVLGVLVFLNIIVLNLRISVS